MRELQLQMRRSRLLLRTFGPAPMNATLMNS
jgi:hypothetical protein